MTSFHVARRPLLPVLALTVLAVVCASTVTADDSYKSQPLEDGAPKEVAEKCRDLMNSKGLRVTDPKGKPFVDLWLRTSIDPEGTKNELGVDFGKVPEGALLGIVKYHQAGRDFRDDKVPAGVYTVRYGLQPEDGDHLGVSETRDFVILSPVKIDVKPDPVAYEDLVKLSAKVSRRKHPAILYLRKLFDKPKELPRLVEDEDHGYWTIDCQIPNKTKGKEAVRLGIVIVGVSEEA